MPLRSRLRDRLIRWLGGQPDQAPPPRAALQSSAAADVQLVLPAPDAARQALLAGQYFAHAEELIRRGAAEFAAPFYRQAYALLRASLGEAVPAADADASQAGLSSERLIDLSQPQATLPQPQPAAQPELVSQTPPTAAASSGSAAAAVPPPAAAPSASPTMDAEALIRSLQSRLNAQTADDVAQQAARLRAQGIQHPDLDHLQGVIHIIKGESSAAAERFRMAIAQAPGHYRSLVNLSGLLLAEGRLEEAQALLQRALEQVNPDSDLAVPALTNLSLVHHAAGRSMEEALLVLKIQRLKPGHLRGERLLKAATVLQEMAEEPAAIELLQWLNDHGGGEPVWRPLATLLERRGDYQAAALVYRRLLQPAAPAAAPTP